MLVMCETKGDTKTFTNTIAFASKISKIHSEKLKVLNTS